MAQIHSDKPTNNSAEEKIYELLESGLDDDWQVWHEPEIRRTEDEEKPYRPDFILLHPKRGLFVLEVKGWRLERILDVTQVKKGKGGSKQATVKYQFSEGIKQVESPFGQLGKYITEIRKQLKERKKVLEMPEKKVSVLLDGAVAFTNIDKNEAENAGNDPLEQQRKKVLTDKDYRGVYKSEVDECKIDPDLVEQTLIADAGVSLELTTLKMDLLRGIVHPESRLVSAPRPRPHVLPSEAVSTKSLDELQMLSQEQESVARYQIGSGHRILFGVAGSGKTMILIARARWRAMLNPEHAILVLCFNRTLSLYIAKVLEDYDNIDVMTFHAWVRERIGYDVDFGDREYDAKLLALLARSDVDKYDSILIDECQDWHPDWFRAVLFAAKDPENGDILIVGDGSQSIYGSHGDFDWRDYGINPQPWRGNDSAISITFDRNYRNTRQIVALATSFARSGKSQNDQPCKGILSLLPDSEECARGPGVIPILARFRDREREMAFVVNQIRGLINNVKGLEPCDFAVIYPGRIKTFTAKEKYRKLFDELEALDICCEHIKGGDKLIRNQEKLLEGNSVKFLNVQQIKGLEQTVCFVIGIEDFEEEDDHLLYVAMTRATDWLYLSWSNKIRTRIIDRLKSDHALYSYHENLGDVVLDPAVAEVLKYLNQEKLRCTYTVLANYLGTEPQYIGSWLGPKCPETSWIVSASSKMPTGYSEDQLHPDLCTNDEVISNSADLRRLLDK